MKESPGEPSAKKRKSSGKPLKPSGNPTEPSLQVPPVEPFVHHKETPESKFMTEATYDDDIRPDATFQSYEEFEQKYNAWKTKHLHPFRVASSEALRTEKGEVSGKFKYRYVVFHCARYGAPRMRGEGKRPNQHYLPCNCTAMIRLNFSYNDQCLRITCIETRHSNHTLAKDLYERMVVKEEKKKLATPRRRTVGGTVERVKQEPVMSSDEGADSEHTQSQSQSPVDFDESIVSNASNVTMNQTIPNLYSIPPPPAHGLIPKVEPMAPPISAPHHFLAMQQYQRLQSQFALSHQMQMSAIASISPIPYSPFATANWSAAPMPPRPSASESSSQASPVSSTVDENEAPKVFHSLEAVRPIALRAHENSAFHQMIHPRGPSETTSLSPIPKSEIDSIIASASRMLHDSNLPSDILQNRVKQLNNLISQWSQ
ncbi:hypothetical protein GCK72_011861 [Caenorhabditis remanei]|uniref:ZSWIM3 N-terminal domain-containing protein n=1 Tax=Caenorhabditis remanei TaxID=31234 RepID=A0A6A5H9U3_CAERE|nr:hypothetical protein GCK72_011861 [Caenorhabditis remanei]KAF1763594.1 hypothetical protein GCK72_011861 [Caenorhabditis remanei]